MSDDFKQIPGHYVAHRPTYPRELFSWLASISPSLDCAWDCATGSGQAALGLAQFFESVIATDLNREQIDHAIAHPRIAYSASPAEECSIGNGAVSLITVACGVHWFDRARFYETARRVLAPGGVLALWTYKWPWTGSKETDIVLARLKDQVLGRYWPSESELYLNGYLGMEFPFDEISVPPFFLECRWGPEDLLGFVSTWSAAQRYLRQNGTSPIDEIEEEFKLAWDREPPSAPINLPLYFRVGRS